ncbi:hypothetical protein CSKR_113811 [Clonorchis sinensis]|uniref:Guanine nucleotide exchange factor DBS n=1 Tax=Clonorchis sinensis TaxID=79923 RepID=A0A8T1MF15_CLOSI|nr:hypothetical protein CSKR_113811 [Clonorchis sinensis]
MSIESLSKTLTNDIEHALRTKYAIFTGGHDREFRSLIIFPDVPSGIVLSDDAFSLLMVYFTNLSSTHLPIRDFTVLIDRRTADWNSVKLLITKIQNFFTTGVHHIYILKPQGLLQRFFVERTMGWIRDGSKFPISFVDKPTELLPFIDQDHLPEEIGGQLTFSLEDWISYRVSVETFRDKVEQLRNREQALLAILQRNESRTSFSDFELTSTSPNLNPAYAPQVVCKLKKKWQQWLDAVIALELEGLRLRQQLRTMSDVVAINGDHHSGDSKQTANQSETAQAHRGEAFDLPVDRVFHVITLEHILVQLTEIRTRSTMFWKQYKRRARITRLIGDVDRQFYEFQPLVSIWDNLLESTLDYIPTHSAHPRHSATALECPCPISDSTEFVDETEKTDVSDDGGLGGVKLEDLEAVLNRLREAEQFGAQLAPELSALVQTSKWIISYVHHKEQLCSPPRSVVRGIESLTRFSLDSDRDSDDESNASSIEAVEEPDDPNLPALVLPPNADHWTVLFDQMLELVNVKIPETLDKFGRMYELFSTIANAREWIRDGHSLSESITPSEKLIDWDLTQCRKQLDELAHHLDSGEETLKLLTSPKQFRTRFATVMNPELRKQLEKLLLEMEAVRSSCQTATATLRQHISRTSFPRQHSSSASLPGRIYSVDDKKLDTLSLVGSTPVSPSHSLIDHVEDQPLLVRTDVTTPCSESESVLVSPARRFQMAWEELVDTERTYVNFLQHVYDVVWLGPCPSSPSTQHSTEPDKGIAPPFMAESQNWLLSNWPDLLYFHRDCLLPALENCNGNVSKLKHWSVQMIPQLVDLYSVYCSSQSNAVQVAVQLERDRLYSSWMSACSEEIGRRESASTNATTVSTAPNESVARPVLQLSSRLVTPVQRIQRYHLLLSHLLRLALTESDRQDLTAAHKAMLDMCEAVNLTMRLRGLSIRPSELGPLLLRGDFTIARDDSRSTQQRHAFLFTNAILLTKFRASATPVVPIIRQGTVIMLDPHLPSDNRAGSFHSLATVPSNIVSLVKSHGLVGSSSSMPGSSASGSVDSGPVYEVRGELLLAQIGLTPSVRQDRRRFAVWTANRAQTYVFCSADASARDRWVHMINDLLMDQLRRLRDEAVQRQNTQRPLSSRLHLVQPSPVLTLPTDRSNSLPSPRGPDKLLRNNASVRSLPSAAPGRGNNARK